MARISKSVIEVIRRTFKTKFLDTTDDELLEELCGTRGADLEEITTIAVNEDWYGSREKAREHQRRAKENDLVRSVASPAVIQDTLGKLILDDVGGNLEQVKEAREYIESLMRSGELDGPSAIQYLKILHAQRNTTLDRFSNLLKDLVNAPDPSGATDTDEDDPSPFKDDDEDADAISEHLGNYNFG